MKSNTRKIGVIGIFCGIMIIFLMVFVIKCNRFKTTIEFAEPSKITSKQIEQLTPDMSREEVIEKLGDTQDIGSGVYIYVYQVDEEYILEIRFLGDEDKLNVTGEELLKQLKPI
ncbi:MAG: hypothetical protein SOZ81_03695 [Agathobacter sp.]|nr:hypothetical protein [Agathobacter sp.]